MRRSSTPLPRSGPRRLDELRATEYRRLDETGQVYLDYTGAGLHAGLSSRIISSCFGRRVLGNPHSDSPASAAASSSSSGARIAVLRHFNASPAEYAVIFTAAASDRRAQAGGGGLSVRQWQPVRAHVRQPQLGERDP